MVQSITDNNGMRIVLTDSFNRAKPEQIGIYSVSGWGKSLCEEGIVNAYYDAGFCIIYLGDGFKGEEEIAFAMFEPEARFHLEMLKREGKPIKKVPVKLYHPYSFNVPNINLPDYNFFTIPVKSLIRRDFSMMAETSSDSDTIRILMQASANLTKEAGIYELLHNIQDLIKGKKKYNSVSGSSSSFFLSVTAGTSKSMQDISNLFQPFKQDYFLVKENCPYNLDFKNILSDNESIHFFSTKYIKDAKMKEFVLLVILNKILEYKDYAKSPVCIVIPEIRKLCPDHAVGYQKYLSEAIKEALSTMRSIGAGGFASILSSQSWSDTDQSVRDSHSVTLLGKINISDIEKISKILTYKKDLREQLANPPGLNSWLIIGRESEGFWHWFFPSWGHAEPEFQFDKMFKKYYPEKMKKPEIIEAMKKMLYEEEEKFKIKSKKEEELERKRLEEKLKGKGKDSNIQEMKNQQTDLKKQEKLKDMERAYNMKKDGSTLVDIGQVLGTSKDSIKRWIEKYKKILESNRSEEQDLNKSSDSDISE